MSSIANGYADDGNSHSSLETNDMSPVSSVCTDDIKCMLSFKTERFDDLTSVSSNNSIAPDDTDIILSSDVSINDHTVVVSREKKLKVNNTGNVSVLDTQCARSVYHSAGKVNAKSGNINKCHRSNLVSRDLHRVNTSKFY